MNYRHELIRAHYWITALCVTLAVFNLTDIAAGHTGGTIWSWLSGLLAIGWLWLAYKDFRRARHLKTCEWAQ